LEVDWWAFGVFLYEMVVGVPPFITKNKQVMYRKIITEEPIFPPTVTEGFADLVSGLLRKHHSDRFGPPDIRASTFYAKIDFT
jgi:serine/threonine protein kinase